MKRRTFTKLAAAPFAFAGALGANPESKPAGPAKMKLGNQNWSDDASLKVLAALGVNHICSALPSRKFDENWSVEGLTRLRERVQSYGVTLAAVPLPLSSVYITKAENPNILLGRSPDRDREIDDICSMIRNCGKASIPMVKYNFNILGVVRTVRTPGRGGSSYSTFRYAEAKQELPLTEAGPLGADEMWSVLPTSWIASYRLPKRQECA